MCGLSGFLGPPAPADELGAAVDRMTATLIHRGPDDLGTWVDAPSGIALGFRRLSIVDLSSHGHQPMHSSCGRWVVVFNGEIYNHVELRGQLEAKGRTFRGYSDTEVMLEAVAEWGFERALERFNGMFAIAMWDRRDRTLALARDRLGIKPLYHGRIGDSFGFASELKAFVAHPRFSARVDRDALSLFMRYGYIPAPFTIYEGVSKLRAGKFLSVSADGSPRGRPLPYWSLDEVAAAGVADPLRASDEEAIEALDGLLRDSIRLQMLADVPVGAFLSGGIDSSLVVALVQRLSSRPVRTFTVGFREAEHDESEHARAVARHLGTDHTELLLRARDALELVPRIPAWYDEPFADSSQLPTYLVAELARPHVTVSLSGDGGDELFAGYPRYRWAEQLSLGADGPLRPLRGAAGRALERAPVDWLNRVATRLGDKLRLAGEILALDGADSVYLALMSHWTEPVVLGSGDREVDREEAMPRFDHPEFLTRMQLLDLGTYLPEGILTKVDRATMAVSLEARVPLLDHRVAEFALRCPRRLRIRAGIAKWILRGVLERYVPRALTDRPKGGFTVPISEWLRGDLREWAEGMIGERRLREDGFLDPVPIRRLWDAHLRGSRSSPERLWSVLMFQAWHDHWMRRS